MKDGRREGGREGGKKEGIGGGEGWRKEGVGVGMGRKVKHHPDLLLSTILRSLSPAPRSQFSRVGEIPLLNIHTKGSWYDRKDIGLRSE